MKGILSLLKDLGYEKNPVLAIDAKATEHILHRQGIGKKKHIDVAFLWIQDEVRSQRLKVRRVRSEDNVADLGTKPLSKAVIAKHCLTMGYVNMSQESAQTVGHSWGDQGISVQQTAGDHVQKAISSIPQQQERPQQRQRTGPWFRSAVTGGCRLRIMPRKRGKDGARAEERLQGAEERLQGAGRGDAPQYPRRSREARRATDGSEQQTKHASPTERMFL